MKDKPHRKMTDLSFLACDQTETTGVYPICIQKAQMSILICGTGEREWIASHFMDSDFDEDIEIGMDEVLYTLYMADRIVNGLRNANQPIWDLRE
jgi:hypothetical protein